MKGGATIILILATALNTHTQIRTLRYEYNTALNASSASYHATSNLWEICCKQVRIIFKFLWLLGNCKVAHLQLSKTFCMANCRHLLKLGVEFVLSQIQWIAMISSIKSRQTMSVLKTCYWECCMYCCSAAAMSFFCFYVKKRKCYCVLLQNVQTFFHAKLTDLWWIEFRPFCIFHPRYLRPQNERII